VGGPDGRSALPRIRAGTVRRRRSASCIRSAFAEPVIRSLRVPRHRPNRRGKQDSAMDSACVRKRTQSGAPATAETPVSTSAPTGGARSHTACSAHSSHRRGPYGRSTPDPCQHECRARPRTRARSAYRQTRARRRRRSDGRPERRLGRPAFRLRRVRAIARGTANPRTRFRGATRLSAQIPSSPLVATSAFLDLVEPLVVANVGQDYRDFANAGKAHIDGARPATRPP